MTDCTHNDSKISPFFFQGPKVGFVCHACFILLTRVHTSHSRRPVTKPVSSSLDAITAALNRSQYYTALSWILRRGPCARRAFRHFITRTARHEIRKYISKAAAFPEIKANAATQEFDWSAIMEEMERLMPVLMGALSGALPVTSKTKNRYVTYR